MGRRAPRRSSSTAGQLAAMESYLHDAWFFGIRTGHAVMVETKMGKSDPAPVILGMQDEFQDLMERCAEALEHQRRHHDPAWNLSWQRLDRRRQVLGSRDRRPPDRSPHRRFRRGAAANRRQARLAERCSDRAAFCFELFRYFIGFLKIVGSDSTLPSGSASTCAAAFSRVSTSSSAFSLFSSGRPMSAISSVVPW